MAASNPNYFSQAAEENQALMDRYLRRKIRSRRLLVSETYAAFVLIAATLLALIWANIGDSYTEFWHSKAGFSLGALDFKLTLHEWVDQALMTLFFFMVGLDVKRDISLGELRDPRKALLPVGAAVSGLVLPALLFIWLTRGQEFSQAWGTVISTDTAFALGMLALVGPRRAPRLRGFLLAFAVIDDIGALAAIAIFYTDKLNLLALGCVGLGLLVVWLLARRQVWRMPPYLIAGVFTWAAMYFAGMHATLSGVLLALLMPVFPPKDYRTANMERMLDQFRQSPNPATAASTRDVLAYSIPLNQRIHHSLLPYVNYLVVPLFALANAGIVLNAETLSAALGSRLLWGVVLGLVVGKLVGVLLGVWLVQKLLPSSRVPGLDMPRIAGVGALSGMGFTISLLLANLALEDPVLRDQARAGVLLASLLALTLAFLIFKLADKFAPLPEPKGEFLQRPFDGKNDHVLGNHKPVVDMVLYFDMANPARYRYAEAYGKAYEYVNRDARIGYAYRHQVSDSASRYAALALEYADEQGKMWDMHAALVRKPGQLSCAMVLEAATEAGLDVEALRLAVGSGRYDARVDFDAVDVPTEHEDSEPLLYIGGRRLDGMMTDWRISKELEAALAEHKQ